MGRDGIPAEVFKYGPVQLLNVMSVLFTGCLKSNYLPKILMDVVVKPIIKTKTKCATDIGNYRPISIATAASKLLEIVIENRLGECLQTTSNQFGFKPRHGTEMAIFTLKQTINFFVSRGSPMYLCFLDAKKAFDRVNHWTLFKKLIERGAPVHIVKLLKYWYQQQQCSIRWGSSTSNPFRTTNGIRQGGLLSPLLFNVYVDSLHDRLSLSRVGCHIGDCCINAISYADDMVLLAPNVDALQTMLNICGAEATTLDIEYNTNKSVCMLVKPRTMQRFQFRANSVLSGTQLEYVDSFPYLGHLITNNRCDNADISKQLRKLNAVGNQLIRKFNFCTMDVTVQLFKTYCYPIYCNSLWSKFTQVSISKLRVAYNDIFRRLIGVPRRTSASFVFAEYDVDCLKVRARKSAYSLQERILFSNNPFLEAICNSEGYELSPIKERWDRILLVQEDPDRNRNNV